MPVLNQLHKSVRRPVHLADSAKTRLNFGFNNPNTDTPYVNDTMNSLTPRGVLAGMVACVDSTTGKFRTCTEITDVAMGLFGIDAAGDPFEDNVPAESGRITVLSGGYHQVDTYETVSYADNATELVYVAGQELFVSPNGLLTNDQTTTVNNGRPVALIEKAPTEDDPTIIFKLYGFTPTLGLSGGPFEPLDATILKEANVVDNLTSTDVVAPLSANQGRILSEAVGAVQLKTKAIILDAAAIATGFVDLGEAPYDRAVVQFYIKNGVPQLNFHINGYDKATMGKADFAMGDRDTNANPSRIYFRSDIAEGGYATDELVDGGAVPAELPAVDSVLMVVYQ